MPIERELEQLHEHLKSLGSAREKLDGATEHIAKVSDAIVNAGESMRRLAEMPELTERIRVSVERLINESRGREILEAIKAAREESRQAADAMRKEQKQLCDQLDNKVKEDVLQARNDIASMILQTQNEVTAVKKMVVVAIVLVAITLLAFAPLIYKVLVATLK